MRSIKGLHTEIVEHARLVAMTRGQASVCDPVLGVEPALIDVDQSDLDGARDGAPCLPQERIELRVVDGEDFAVNDIVLKYQNTSRTHSIKADTAVGDLLLDLIDDIPAKWETKCSRLKQALERTPVRIIKQLRKAIGISPRLSLTADAQLLAEVRRSKRQPFGRKRH
jgi:hypothetical protein